jgi:hypothetical protein
MTIGTALFFLTIPLLSFGGWRLDCVEKDTPLRCPQVVGYEDANEDH